MKNTATYLMLFLCTLFLFPGCVTRKKFLGLESEKKGLDIQLADALSRLDQAESDLDIKNFEISSLNNEIAREQRESDNLRKDLDYFQRTNTTLLDRMADLSVISQSGVESIKESLKTLRERNEYIRELTKSIRSKDSVNLILVMNLKRSLASLDDEDVTVEVKKGVVYVSLSDKLLFESGSAVINSDAKRVLGKIAKVVNDHSHLDLLVEGHTDTVRISSIECIDDNWDLSVKRSTEVVKVLQDQFKVAPERLTASGRSKYAPKATNMTAKGRSQNRRTEIIITPKLDEFFKLLEPGVYEKIDKM